MSDEERCETGEALVGVPGSLPPLADLPHPAPPPHDDELWSYAAGELTAGPDLAAPLRILVILALAGDVLLALLVIVAVVR